MTQWTEDIISAEIAGTLDGLLYQRVRRTPDAVAYRITSYNVCYTKLLRDRQVILFVDEPYMASFGSAYVSLEKEQVIAWLDEVYEALHAAGAITGTHCCRNNFV